jgi:hypothetical protein
MRWNFGNRERVRLLAATFAQRVPAANVERRPATQIGQCKIDTPVAAKGGA